MTLEQINTLVQAVALLAILATLIVQVWQAQQAARIARAELTLNAHLQIGMIHRELADTPEKAELMVRLLTQTTPPTPTENVQLTNIVGIAIGAHEAMFSLRVRGLIEEPTYVRLAAASRLYLQSSGARRVWKTLRTQGSDSSFVAELDAIVAEIEAEEMARPSASAGEEATEGLV